MVTYFACAHFNRTFNAFCVQRIIRHLLMDVEKGVM